MPVQLPVNISNKSGEHPFRAPDGSSENAQIPRFIFVDKTAIDQLNKEKNGPHIKIVSQDDKIYKILVSEYLAMALLQQRRGRAPIDNNLLKVFNDLFKPVFRGNLKKSLQTREGATIKAQETPFGRMITSTLIVVKSKKSGYYFAVYPIANVGMGYYRGIDDVFEIKNYIKEVLVKKLGLK